MNPRDLSRVTLVHSTKRRSPLRYTLMEAVAVAHGGERTETPRCTCPVLATFASYLNDCAWPDDASRTAALLPLVPLLRGNRSTPDLRERRRAYFADCLVRWYLPLAVIPTIVAWEDEEMPCSGLRAAAGRYVEAPSPATLADLQTALGRVSRRPRVDGIARLAYQAMTARPSTAIIASTLDELTLAWLPDVDAETAIMRLAADHLAEACALR